MWRGTIGVVLLLFVLPAPGRASFERTFGDAQAGALAGAGVGWLSECARPFGNPAHLGWVRGVPLRATSGCLYGIEALRWQSLWGGRRSKRGALGAGVAQLGSGAYREITVGASLGSRSGDLGYGVTLRALLLGIEGLGSRCGMALDLGMSQRLSERFALGLLASGVNFAGRSDRDPLVRPRLILGAAFRPGGGFVALLDIEQASGAPRRTRVAVEAPLGAAALLRAGRVTEPGEVCLGMGLRRGRRGVDASVRWHPVLGWSYRMSILLGLPEQSSEGARGEEVGEVWRRGGGGENGRLSDAWESPASCPSISGGCPCPVPLDRGGSG